jgi:hypothetical protein
MKQIKTDIYVLGIQCDATFNYDESTQILDPDSIVISFPIVLLDPFYNDNTQMQLHGFRDILISKCVNRLALLLTTHI